MQQRPRAIGGGLLSCAVLCAFAGSAFGDGAEAPGEPNTSDARRIGGVKYVRPASAGTYAIGFSRLFYLARDAKRWKLLYRATGDNLYRVAVEPGGALAGFDGGSACRR